MITHLKYLDNNNRTKLFDIIYEEQLRSPKGGVKIKGKFFPGGQFIPTDGGYAKEFKKMKDSGDKNKHIEKNTRRLSLSNEYSRFKQLFKENTAKQNKKNVVANLVKKTGLHYVIINRHVANWAQTSADNSPDSLGLQFMAKDIFNAGKTSHLNDKHATTDELKETFIKAIYTETQQWFKDQGYEPDDEIILYRGVVDKIKSGKYALQPLSSFSFSKKVASDFARQGHDGTGGTVFAIRTSVKNIFSTPLTGIGCTDELEAVVIGRDVDINVSSLKEVTFDEDIKDIGEFDDVVIKTGIKNLKGMPEHIHGYFDCFGSEKLESLEGGPKIVDDYFKCSAVEISSLKGAPEKVGDYFDCSYNPKLKSMEGGPREVDGSFRCTHTAIKSLKGAPEMVGRNFICNNNPNLESLEGVPRIISGHFDCSSNSKLKTLEGCPEKVTGDFVCTGNENLISLEGCPKEVGGAFDCSYNPKLKSLKGCPEKVDGNFYCSKAFTEEQIRKVCKVKGNVVLSSIS